MQNSSTGRKRIDIDLPGTIVPPLTPFTSDLKVDYDALKHMVDYVVEDCGASLVIAAGVEAQEYHFLEMAERKELIAKTIEFVEGRCPVAVGISHPSTRVAIDLAHFAQDKGAAAIQLLAPLRASGGVLRQSEMVAYFEAILKASDLPMMLYLNAGPGADLSVPATIELAKLDGIEWVKESSRDLNRISRLVFEIEHAGHAKYFTTMQVFLATLALGGSGVTVPPPAAQITRKIITAYTKGDFAEAARLQSQLALFPAQWMEFGLASVMKAALAHLGVPSGVTYAPFEPISGASLDKLKAQVDTMDLAKKGKANA
jgi:4-hydroxy-tetrahydrodipicolinate synthase